MAAAPPMPDEPQRIDALRKLGLMGTPAEERFDKITRLAKRALNVPVSVIDLIGDTRVWLKSVQGLDMMEASRPESYCQHTILEDGVCHIRDSMTDMRVCDIAGAETYRSYLGVPLQYDGKRVGVICVCDFAPRDFTPDDIALLWDMATLVERELHVQKLSAVQLKLAAEHEALTEKALVDVLTRIWNRGAITEIAARELERGKQQGAPTSIVLLDIDHFKAVNDTYGHAAGDEVLRKVAERLRAAIRPADAVGRWGGEEFLVVLPGCSHTHLQNAAERIRSSVAKSPITYENTEIPVTISLGSTTSDGSHFVEVLVLAADEALYKSKGAGRNQTSHKSVSPSILMKAVKP